MSENSTRKTLRHGISQPIKLARSIKVSTTISGQPLTDNEFGAAELAQLSEGECLYSLLTNVIPHIWVLRRASIAT
jgi:hypothetical protein